MTTAPIVAAFSGSPHTPQAGQPIAEGPRVWFIAGIRGA